MRPTPCLTVKPRTKLLPDSHRLHRTNQLKENCGVSGAQVAAKPVPVVTTIGEIPAQIRYSHLRKPSNCHKLCRKKMMIQRCRTQLAQTFTRKMATINSHPPKFRQLMHLTLVWRVSTISRLKEIKKALRKL